MDPNFTDPSLLPPEERERLIDSIGELLRRQETVEALLHTVLPHLPEGERVLVYILDKIARIGHLCQEPFMVNGLYGDSYDRILLLTARIDQPGVNQAVFEILGPKFIHVETDDPVLPLLGVLDGGLAEFGPFDLWLVAADTIQDLYVEHVSGAPITSQKFALSPGLRSRGDRWLETIGIGEDDPVVMLHVRDMSFLPGRSQYEYRCASIENYGPAIDWLVARGYRVFRIGDTANPPLGHESDRVIDVPHQENYDGFMDVYLGSRSHFAITGQSGPDILARSLGTPCLMANTGPAKEICHMPPDIFLPKPLYHVGGDAMLTYQEILDLGLPAFSVTEQFTEAGVVVGQNSPEDILNAVEEIDRTISSDYPFDPEIEVRFRAMSRDFDDLRRAQFEAEGANYTTYSYANPWGRLSQSFVRSHPHWLD